jgi:hypothetical protein
MEVTFFERAQPGTFADWQLQHFTDAELNDSSVGSSHADPDGDGLPNLLEFAQGGDPLMADATNASANVFFARQSGGNSVSRTRSTR